jgi:transposase, IS30 family
MRSYQQLTREQRYQIYALLKMGHNQTETAQTVGVHKTTISRELGRNTGQRGYRPQQAQQFSQARLRLRVIRSPGNHWQNCDKSL